MKSDPIEKHIEALLVLLGENPQRPGLQDTPKRVARSLRYLTSGADNSWDHLLSNALFDSNSQEIILLKNIEFSSLCEHHLLPFIGQCHIAYIPQGKIIGLSRIPRIVDFYARRLQIQEQLTAQIAEGFMKNLNVRGVAVLMEAEHLCMTLLSAEKQHTRFQTSAMLGLFQDDASKRNEVLHLLNTASYH
jgi:GTP cyclohydrolase IA